MRQGARQGAPAPRTERCRQKGRSVHSLHFRLLPYEIIKTTTRKVQSVFGKRACVNGVSVSNYFETETNNRNKIPDIQHRMSGILGYVLNFWLES